MRIAIIGAGVVSASHAEAIREIGQTIDTVVDVDQWRARRAAGQYGIPRFETDWRHLLDRDDIDVIDICTPPQFHREIAVAALAAGKHVICEKPLAASLKDADAILDAANESSAQLLVCHQFRYSPFYQRLEWLVDQDYLGKIHFARVQRYDPPPKDLVERGAWGQWTLTGGGVLMTKAIHQVDMLLGLLGPARRVQAMMGTFLSSIESEDHVTANIEFESGAIANVCVSGQPFGARGHHFDLLGSKAAVGQPWHVWKANGGEAPEIVHELNRRFPIPEDLALSRWKHLVQRVGWKFGRDFYPPQPPANTHAPLFRRFFAAVAQGDPSPVTADDGRAAVELCSAIYQAALTGSPVDLPLDSTSMVYSGIRKDDYVASTAG